MLIHYVLNLFITSIFQVTASAWINDLRNQIERTRILRTVYRSASALSSRLPSIASAKAKVAGAGAILRPVSSSTRVALVLSTIYFSMHYLVSMDYPMSFHQRGVRII